MRLSLTMLPAVLPIALTCSLMTACTSMNSPGPATPAKPAAAPAPVVASSSTVTVVESRTTPPAAPKPAFGSPEFNALKDSGPATAVDVSKIPDAVPRAEPLAKYGNTSPYTVLGEAYTILPTAKGFTQTGTASWYGSKFHGMKTSSGDRYDMYAMTAAHRNLPLPTYVRVTNTANGKSVVVKVNDRGPFHTDRIMDLSYAAAVKLDIVKSGTATVTIEALDPPELQPSLDASGHPLAATTTDAITQFYVQVGAFRQLDNATSLQGKLLDLVYAPINITDGDKPDAIHRVQIGPFYSRDDAEKMSQIIKDNKLGEPRIVTP